MTIQPFHRFFLWQSRVRLVQSLFAVILLVGTQLWALPAQALSVTVTPYAFPADLTGSSRLYQVGSYLYGTTATGGAENLGTVFRFDPATGAFATVYSFTAADGIPTGGVIADENDVLYGTTRTGGTQGFGIVYRLTLAGQLTVLHSFGGSTNGDGSGGGELTLVRGLLYGTTAFGGNSSGYGTVFQLARNGENYSVVHIFGGYPSDGNRPIGQMLLVDHFLYGTTARGGAGFCYAVSGRFDPYGCGSIFKLDLDTFAFTTTTTQYPPANGGLIRGSDGCLYGSALYATYGSSRQGNGNLFRYDPATNLIEVFYSFSSSTPGLYPEGGVISSGRYLYGTTSYYPYSSNYSGSIFRYDLSAGALTTLHVLNGFLRQPLIETADDSIYGTSDNSSSDNTNALFKLQVSDALQGLPDLAVTAFTSSPANPKVGDIVQFSVTVQNSSTATASTPPGTIVGVGFFDSLTGGSNIAFTDTYTTSIPPGASVTLTTNQNWSPTLSGARTITAIVDDINRMAEADETNNSLAKTVNVREASEQDLPDLTVIDFTSSPANPNVGDIVQFSVTVQNSPTATAPTPPGTIVGVGFFDSLTGGSNVAFTDTYTASIPPGASVTLLTNKNWTPALSGTHTITAIVDDINRIPEADETNNSLAKTIVVP